MSIASNVTEFQNAVSEFADVEVPREALKFQKAVYYDLIKGVVNMTPVKTGRARANWVVTRTDFYQGQWFKKTDPTGEDTIAKAWRVINQMKAYENCYLTNNLPYIERLENGWSKQAPQGMVKITMAFLVEKYGLEE